MSLKRSLRRVFAILLAAVVLAGSPVFPGSRIGAETEFPADNTGFTDPSIESGIMYFWHEGIPNTAKDKGGNFIYYPILITWKGQYYLCTDTRFKSELDETHTLREDESCKQYVGGSPAWNVIGGESYEDWDRIWGDADYFMRYLYDMSGNALLSRLDLDMNDLIQLGEAVSMGKPTNVPFLVCTKPETNQYAIGLDERAFGKDVWLVGRTRTWEKVITSIVGYDRVYSGDVQWGLDYEYWDANQFLDKHFTFSETRSLYGGYTKTYTEGPDQHYWTVTRDGGGKYHFWTTGESDVSGMERASGSVGPEANRERIKNWHSANDIFRGALYYSGSTIGAKGASILYKDWNQRVNSISNTDGYTVYYGDPNIVSFHRQSFEVADGQVVNLDGPRVIDSNCTVTVRPGGVLACSGWVINNGQIVVEPGGMLILTERETATGDYQYGAITSVDTVTNSANGRIACDGIIVINRDCKLTCAGTYGLQLGEGAKVVNYGQIIAENLDVYSDHTIENRGETSAVFAGWGLTNSGYALTRSKITGSSYRGQGTQQKAAAVRMTADAVYGEGASRVYVNSASTVTRTTLANRQGYVSGYKAPLANLPDDGGGAELPSNVPIYYDERYDTCYVINNDIPYHYDKLACVWVYYPPEGEKQYYHYRMPSKVDRFIDGQLPDGYKLSSGLIVGRKMKDDLYYDHTRNLYWFAENGLIYYYEEAVQDYIHVKDLSSYFRFREDLDPPPGYLNIESMPSRILKQMDGNPILYVPGMQEVENLTGRPPVQLEGNRYYVDLNGVKYYWNTQYQQFLQDGYTLEDGKPVGGLPRNMADPGYYDLDEAPDAKPKVKKNGDGRYYVEYQGEVYYWYSSTQTFLNGSPVNYAGKPLEKSAVDLNGYTLP